MPHRVHVFGASCAGTTTLGRQMASALGARFLDADRYDWFPTDPPFRHKRDPADRVAMIERDVEGLDDWVLSGSLCSWGAPLLDRFTLAVFLYLAPDVRMPRLAARERQRYGDRIDPGGDLHERWLTRLACPVLRLEAPGPVDALCASVVAQLAATR